MSSSPFRILAVCSMNICRSPAMQQQLETQVPTWEQLGAGPVEVVSAGTRAEVGAPNCEVTLAHIGVTDWSSTATKLTAGALEGSDLILTAALNHVSKAVQLTTAPRTRLFTIRQAARLARSIVMGPAFDVAVAKAQGQTINPTFDEPHTLTEPLPLVKDQRLQWLVKEMNEVRGMFPAPPAQDAEYDSDDVPDPHVLGYALHSSAAELIHKSVSEFSESIVKILEVNVGTDV